MKRTITETFLVCCCIHSDILPYAPYPGMANVTTSHIDRHATNAESLQPASAVTYNSYFNMEAKPYLSKDYS